MTYIDKKLLQASKEGNKIAPEVGSVGVGIYLGYEQVIDKKYNKVRYKFDFKTDDGSVKTLSTSARKSLGKMALIAPGSKVQITKLGEGVQTEYDIKVLAAAKQAAQVEIEQEVVEEQEEEVDPLEANF
jgi:hypothetical protein